MRIGSRRRAGGGPTTVSSSAAERTGMSDYGLFGKLMAVVGEGDTLAGHLLEAAVALEELAACRLYVVSRDPVDPEAVWVMEVWESAEAHRASLELAAVQELIARARPLLAGMGERFGADADRREGPGVQVARLAASPRSAQLQSRCRSETRSAAPSPLRRPGACHCSIAAGRDERRRYGVVPRWTSRCACAPAGEDGGSCGWRAKRWRLRSTL